MWSKIYKWWKDKLIAKKKERRWENKRWRKKDLISSKVKTKEKMGNKEEDENINRRKEGRRRGHVNGYVDLVKSEEKRK